MYLCIYIYTCICLDLRQGTQIFFFWKWPRCTNVFNVLLPASLMTRWNSLFLHTLTHGQGWVGGVGMMTFLSLAHMWHATRLTFLALAHMWHATQGMGRVGWVGWGWWRFFHLHTCDMLRTWRFLHSWHATQGMGRVGWVGWGWWRFFHLHTCDMLRAWRFLHLHTCDMLRKAWGGLGGWGGDDDVSFTCTHVTCYALDVSCTRTQVTCYARHGEGWVGGVGMMTFLSRTHVTCYALDVSCTCTHVTCYALDVSCTCTHVTCYASHGEGWVGGVGMMTFLSLAHMWHATHTFSCTCAHVTCYALDVSCTCTHVTCYASHGEGWVGGVGMVTFLSLAHMWHATHTFSCTCAHVTCYGLGNQSLNVALWNLPVFPTTKCSLQSGTLKLDWPRQSLVAFEKTCSQKPVQ